MSCMPSPTTSQEGGAYAWRSLLASSKVRMRSWRSVLVFQVAAVLLLAYIALELALEGGACRLARSHRNVVSPEPPAPHTSRVPEASSEGSLHATSGGRSNSAHKSKEGELEFVSYTSSKIEQLFIEKLPEMIFPTEHSRADKSWLGFTSTNPPAAYCEFVNTFEQQIMHWLTKVEESKRTGAMYFDDEVSREIFSVYEFQYKCSSEAAVGGYCGYKTMIEPLAFTLRHPVALCYETFPDKSKLLENKQNSLMDQSYLFYATSQLVDFGPAQHTHVDLGALVRGYGETHFLIREYEKQGIEFSKMLMWEAKQVTGDTIFSTVPDRWYHAYQYFNVPVSTNVTSQTHPLQILKRAHPGTGFVSFKLDIDQNEIENTVAQTLIASHDQYPSIAAGQFEFFFEQHVDLPMMRPYWKTTATESGRQLGDSYELFLQMRQLGIRAHGWV